MDKKELIEIKKDKTGTGLLIENDGYIKLTEGERKTIKESLNGESEWYVPYPFIVDAVFQKFGIKNANGRIYPENVLKREVDKYQEKIDQHMALGECYKPDALILTEEGWKTLEDVKEGENILTLNTETNEIEIKPIIRKIEKDWDDNLITIVGDGINDEVTPNHQYIIYDDKAVFFKRVRAIDIIRKHIPDMSKKFIPTMGQMISLNPNDLKFGTKRYQGKVMCVEVENHTFYVSCNGKEHWTSNCNHPSESVIDLSRVSHNIIELHWEGRTLVGKMELNTTEGFRKHGIVSSRGDEVANLLLNGYKIGVSSRGVGSVEQKLGQLIVGDDFELICWDVVSDPSTNNAYISTDGKEGLSTYLESKNAPKKENIFEKKINKIKNILEN